MFLKVPRNLQENTGPGVSKACNVINKETPAQDFSGEFSEIFKNTFLQSTSRRLPYLWVA